MLGNRQNGGRSPRGVLYYVAVYGDALTIEEIEHNAARLASSDDA